MTFDAIFFDLFNTLLHFDYSLLPEVEFNGERIRTTSVQVYRRLSEEFAISSTYEEFLAEFLESQQIAALMKQEELREVPSLRRFQILSERLKLSADGAAELMVEAHMGEMFRLMYFPPEKRAVFERLTAYPLFLVSNFDHAPTERRALRKFGMEQHFKAIFISEEVGWRKPSPQFFQCVVEKSGVVASQCLYVGDDPNSDVYGAACAGFQVAWLAEAENPPVPPIQPRWILRRLADILDLVRDS